MEYTENNISEVSIVHELRRIANALESIDDKLNQLDITAKVDGNIEVEGTINTFEQN